MNPDLQAPTAARSMRQIAGRHFPPRFRAGLGQPSTQGMPARLDAEVILTFNQPMDTASVEANFQLVDPATPVPENHLEQKKIPF
jgi:hypothetical protein